VFAAFCGPFGGFLLRIDRQMRFYRTLPSPAGAGSYGALSETS
jgi:hypothetical protein